TTRRACSALASPMLPSQIGGEPSRTCPDATKRGSVKWCWARLMWAPATTSRLPHISRTPVTPLTRNKGPNVGSVLDHAAWTCMSHNPGMRNLPVASYASPPFGIRTARLGPRVARRFPFTTTSNTSLVWECIPASKPGANLVNPANGPLTVSPQIKDEDTPGIMALKDAVCESAKITAPLCPYPTAPVTAKAVAIPPSVNVRFIWSYRVGVIALLESSLFQHRL